MRTKTWKLAILSLVAAAAFTSCDNDDDYYYVAGGDAWLSYGNLEAIDNGGYSKYAIRRDDGSRLIINDGIALRSEDAKEGMRVYTHYGILASERDDSSLDGGMNYYIRLYGIQDVLTKAPVLQSFINGNEQHRTDSIGNDPINVSEAWFGGNYLNMEFYIPVKGNSSTAHFINLVVDDVAPATNDTVYVTLRHNAYDDKPGEGRVPGDYRWAWGNVSFDLTSLLPEGATSVPVKLTWTGYKGGNFGETEVHTESGVFTLSAATKALAGGLNDSRSNAESATAQTPTVTCR